MSELETKLSETSELTQLKEQCGQLRRLTTILLLGLVVLSYTMAFFVGFQLRRVGKELDGTRPQAEQIMVASGKEEPMIKAFTAKLADYARTHPEFQQAMAKYRFSTNVTATAPAPAPAPK